MKSKAKLIRRPLLESSLSLGCVLAAGLTTVSAAPLYWDGPSAGWDLLGNWSTTAAAAAPDPAAVPGALDDVTFNIDPVDGATVVSLNGPRAARSLVFNNTGTTLLQGGSANSPLAIGAGGITVDAAAGAATIGSATAPQQVNVSLSASQTWLNNSATPLVLATPFTAGAGIGLIKAGTGNIYMSNTANTTNIGGLLDVQAGKFLTAGDVTAGQISGAGHIENGGAASKWIFVGGNNSDATFGGNITGNPANPAVRLGLVKRGTGALTLAGSNDLGDRFAVENGTLRLTGSTNVGFAAAGANNVVTVGSIGAQNGRVIVDGGTLTTLRTANPALTISSANNAQGFLKMTSGTINSAAEMQVGTAKTTSFAAYTQTGGALTVNNWIAVGFNNDRSIFNQSGGTIAHTANRMTIGAGGNASIGVVNLSGGTYTSTAGANTGMFVGENGTGTLNISGSAVVTLNTNGAAASGTLQFAGNATSLAGTVNLLGGSLSTFGVTKGASTGASTAYQLNLNGGTLKALANNPAFFNDIAAEAYVHAGGGTIDNGGFNITVAEPLLAPTGGGVSAIGLTVSGGGYLDTPMVILTGGDGTGATAVATIDAAGNLTGIVMTNPGVNYTTPPTFTLYGGGFGNTGAITGTATIVTNTSGGMTFAGSGTGTTTVTGANTFTGPVTVSGGRLAMSGAQGNAFTVNSGGSLTPHGPAALLSVPALTLANGSNATFELSTANANNDQIEVTTPGTGLNLGTATITLYEEGGTTAFTTLGTYTLFKYTTGFTGPVSGLSVANPVLGYTYTFAATGSEITVNLASNDTDGDGLPNAWETANGLNPNSALGVNGAGGNLDGDFATNLEEFLAGTAANNPASDPLNVDNDGMLDSWEVANFGTAAARNGTGDYDGDLATDLAEFTGSTNPLSGDRVNLAGNSPDSDGDQITDAWELKYFPALTSKNGTLDSDMDGFSDYVEFLAFTSPVDAAWTPEKSKIIHRWSFTNSLADEVPSLITGPDQHANSPAAIFDPNGAAASTAVTLGATDVLLPGGASATTDAIRLGTNLMGGRAVPAAIEVWASQLSVQNFSRIFDFGSGTTEFLTMTWSVGNNINSQRAEWRDLAANLTDPAGQPFILNNEYHIVCTFEPGLGAGGLNLVNFHAAPAASADLGIPLVTFTTANNFANLVDTFDFLGRSMFPGDNVAHARYNEVRIWDGALAGDQREKLHDAGPDSIDLTDSDNDGLVDSWELAYFPALTTTTGAVDSDLDGFDNAAEQAGRSIPTGTGALASTPPDRDADGLADEWEALNFANLAQTGTGDPDGDFATNEQEESALTNPNNAASWPDSDGDLLADAWETFYFGDLDIDNTASDIDDGGVDADTDGFSDRVEFESGSNPIDPLSHPAVLFALPATGTDAASGISSSKTYTHAIDIGATVTAVSVNGVAFHQSSVPAAGTDGTNNDRWTSLDNTGGRNGPFTLNKSVANDWAQNNANVANIAADGNMLALLTDFSNMTGSAAQLPAGTTQTWTLGGLTPGTAYSLRLYYRPWTLAGDRTQTITINGDGRNVATTVNPDESAAAFAGYVRYDYVANDTDVVMTFRISNALGSSWHQHAITNEVLPAGDSDSDNLPDVWETANFGNITAQTGTGDADTDGTNNRSEFLLGLSPVDSAQRFSATESNVVPGTGATLTWPAQAGLTFTVHRSPSLTAGSWTQLGGPITATGTTASYTDTTAPAGRAFYRIFLTTP